KKTKPKTAYKHINQTTIDPSTSVNRSTVFGSCSSKRTKIEDEDPEHVGSDYIEDECSVKDNKVYVDESNKSVGCVINENVKKNCSEEGDGSGGNAINVSRKRGRSKK
ncbi:7118_t:CDS:2, partial [Racocetra fulgida]